MFFVKTADEKSLKVFLFLTLAAMLCSGPEPFGQFWLKGIPMNIYVKFHQNLIIGF